MRNFLVIFILVAAILIHFKTAIFTQTSGYLEWVKVDNVESVVAGIIFEHKGCNILVPWSNIASISRQ